jgi:hypothetical protein
MAVPEAVVAETVDPDGMSPGLKVCPNVTGTLVCALLE